MSTGANSLRQSIDFHRVAIAIAALLLVALALQELSMIRTQSLSWDEGADFFAGYSIWKRSDYGLNAAHPPLAEMVAAAPLLSLDLKAPPPPLHKLEGDALGTEFLFGNAPGYSGEALIWRGRLAVGVFILLLAFLTFLAGRQMFGAAAGVVALALLVFDPNVLAHGMYATTDIPVTCLTFATVYALYRYVKTASLGWLAVAGAAAGLALATKHTAILIVPITGLLLACAPLAPAHAGLPRPAHGRWLRSRLGSFSLLLAVAFIVLWSCYGFRYSARPQGLALDPTLAQQLNALPHWQARLTGLIANWHVLPEAWISGLLTVHQIAAHMPSYLLGTLYAHGPWFYFPVLLTIKCTLGFLGLAALTVLAFLTRRLRWSTEVLFLVLPPAVILLVAMISHLNLGVRHILPVWPFACLLIAAGCCALIQANRHWVVPVAGLLLIHVASSLRAHPDYLAYSNEAWGGGANTYRYVGDSNVDWGQELSATRTYLNSHRVRECWFAYAVAPTILPEYYGIHCKRLPTAASIDANEVLEVPPVIQGPVLISASELYGLDYEASALNPYVQFRTLRPSAMIQDGVLVFEGSFSVAQLAALSHVQKSTALLCAQRTTEALREARIASQLAPGDLRSEVALGDALAAAGSNAEARIHHERALSLARPTDGLGRESWVPSIEARIASDVQPSPGPASAVPR